MKIEKVMIEGNYMRITIKGFDPFIIARCAGYSFWFSVVEGSICNLSSENLYHHNFSGYLESGIVILERYKDGCLK